MLVEVKIKGQVITSQYGTLGSGDVLRCSKEFADHLVNDCYAAEFVEKTVTDEKKVTVEKTSKK